MAGQIQCYRLLHICCTHVHSNSLNYHNSFPFDKRSRHMCLNSLSNSEGHQEVTLTPLAKLRVVARGQQTVITAVLDSLLHGAVTQWCVWGVRQARQLKVYWGRVAGLLPPRPLRGVPRRATESVNCRPAVILVYSHHPQHPLTTSSTKPVTSLKIVWVANCLELME